MKRLVGMLVMALFIATSVHAVTPAANNQAQAGNGQLNNAQAMQKEPHFHGLGFAFKDTKNDQYTVCGVKIDKISQAGSQGGAPSGQGAFIVSGGADQPPTITSNVNGDKGPVSFVAGLMFGNQRFPLKVIKPGLAEFEADVFDPMDLGAKDKGLRLPCGHLSFKVTQPDGTHTVAEGVLKLKTTQDKASGEYRVLFNELKPPADNGSGPAQ